MVWSWSSSVGSSLHDGDAFLGFESSCVATEVTAVLA